MKADLHVHSTLSSDGSLAPVEILKRMKNLGFGAVAILDHNTIEGSLTAAKIAREMNMIIIRGLEISSSEGHIGALGIGEMIDRNLKPEDTVERIHDLGGIAVALHPYRFGSGVKANVVRRCKFDAVEILNGRTSPIGNEKANRLCKAVQLPLTAGSDAHLEFELGKAFISCDECESEEDLIERILKGEVVAGGESRSIPDTVRYVSKTVGEWIRRGFKRI